MLVLERLDESLIMMKRLFKWATRDLLYLTVNEGCGKVRPWDGRPIACPLSREQLNTTQVARLNELLQVDLFIYEEANRRLDNFILNAGKDEFLGEVDTFRATIRRFRDMCTSSLAAQHLRNECTIYIIGDFPGGYEKLARDCTIEKHLAHGVPNFACQALRNAARGAAGFAIQETAR